MGVLEVTINCPDAASARTIAEALVSERLVACANIGAGIESLYHWKGAVEREPEVPLHVKTRPDLWQAVCARVLDLHPYETPSILGTEMTHVNADYAQWVADETR